jgi:hypothetical protein
MASVLQCCPAFRGEVPRVAIHRVWRAAGIDDIKAEEYESFFKLVRDVRRRIRLTS